MELRGVNITNTNIVASGSGPVLSNLTMYLNANDSASYPGTGTTWFDISGFGADIALNNSPTFTASSPAYFTFNGSNQYGLGSTNGVLDNTKYTKSVWFYLNGYGDNNLSSSAPGGHFMYMATTNKIYSGHTDWPNYGAFPSVFSFSLNTWYYVALTFDTTVGMSLYVNGVLDSTYTANKSAFTGNGSTNVATFGGGNLLNGRISQAFFYNKRLSGAEVLQNYNSTKSIYGY
jgi:Concanavalin A-like lectin/glucanases superfamily